MQPIGSRPIACGQQEASYFVDVQQRACASWYTVNYECRQLSVLRAVNRKLADFMQTILQTASYLLMTNKETVSHRYSKFYRRWLVIQKFWWLMPLFLDFISVDVDTSTLYENTYWTWSLQVQCGLDMVWRLAFSGAKLLSIVLRLKSAQELNHSHPMGIGLCGHQHYPMGRPAQTIQTYFKITQPGSSTVTPLYQQMRLMG